MAASTNTTSGARASAVPTGPAASASASGTTATVTWSAVTMPSGGAVSGYQLTRVNTVTSATTPATGGCAGTITGLSCSEASLTTGRWAYRILAVRGGWTGALGTQSSTLAIDATAPTTSAAVIATPSENRASGRR